MRYEGTLMNTRPHTLSFLKILPKRGTRHLLFSGRRARSLVFVSQRGPQVTVTTTGRSKVRRDSRPNRSRPLFAVWMKVDPS